MGGIIQFSQLGHLGRFGNQLFQYVFAKAYAESVGAVLETPPWIGQVLFEDIKDPPLSRTLTTLGMDVIPRNGMTDINLSGYYQFKDAFSFYSKDTVRRWFTFKREWTERFAERKPLVCHIRRGDYVTTFSHCFCIIEEECYQKAIETFGYSCQEAFIVRENNPTNFPHPGLEWLQDFFTLMNAKVLFRANSTFSWWAGELGPDKEIFSPLVKDNVGRCDDIAFVHGNWPRCTTQPNTSDYVGFAGEDPHARYI